MLEIITVDEMKRDGIVADPSTHMQIDDTHYAVIITEHPESGCRWMLDSIRRLTDEEMKAEDLYCRYRYQEHVISAPEGYNGATEINAGFNLRDESTYYSKDREAYCEQDARHNYLLSI